MLVYLPLLSPFPLEGLSFVFLALCAGRALLACPRIRQGLGRCVRLVLVLVLVLAFVLDVARALPARMFAVLVLCLDDDGDGGGGGGDAGDVFLLLNMFDDDDDDDGG